MEQVSFILHYSKLDKLKIMRQNMQFVIKFSVLKTVMLDNLKEQLYY